MPKVPRYFALVPAAGSGARMGADTPKQYLELAGRPLLHYALKALSAEPRIEQVYVVVSPADATHAAACLRDFPRARMLTCGGATRAESVLNGLLAAAPDVGPDDWVLVHDAARPCLSAGALARLVEAVSADETGGLLAVPVADTLKRAGADDRVVATEPRTRLWQAQTPQMFRYRVLCEALRRAGPEAITDEASAIERMGLRPKLVMGETRNLKVTYPEDLELARQVLAQ